MKKVRSLPLDFYDNISVFYDEMISFDAALLKRRAVISNLIMPGMKTACDLGSGSGLDSISLAMSGLDVTAFDISAGMIKAAKKNSLSRGVNVKYVKSSIDKISITYHNKFNIAVSLGNSLANLDPKTLKAAFKKIYSLLKKNSTFVIQLLNYEMIMKQNKRIVKISKGNTETTIRFYDILPGKFNFNILKFNNLDPAVYELNTTSIYPYGRKSISAMLSKAGFKRIKVFGKLKLGKFELNSSGDLVVICNK